MRNSEPSQNRMAVYMRQRRLAKRVGMTVKQWVTAGCPKPKSGTNEPDLGAVNTLQTTEGQSSPVEAPGAI